ncbi:CHAT domain-containing protein [Nonomuraea insulae]|uniref:CHAT domain-containing protein n=1 Tax=Nonomuraea insulae TaxID=1616787 RepID=A0ABW1CGE8_9ACTN
MTERERLMQAIRTRLDRFSGDRWQLLEPEGRAEARRLARIVENDPGDTLAHQILAWFHFSRHLAQPEGEGELDLGDAISAGMTCFMGGLPNESLPKHLLPLVADHADLLLNDQLRRVLRTTEPDQLWYPVWLCRRVLAALPEGDARRSDMLHRLAIVLQVRFRLTGDPNDLDEAIDAVRQAVDAATVDHPLVADMFETLEMALETKLRRGWTPAGLDQMIDAARQALAAASGRAGRFGALGTRWLLGTLHGGRAMTLPVGADQPDMRAAVEEFTVCFVAGIPEAALPERMLPVLAVEAIPAATDLLQQAPHATDPDVPAITVRMWRRILDHLPADHQGRAGMLSNLSIALQIQFERDGGRDIINEAVETAQQAVDATDPRHPDWAGRLSNLASALQFQIQHEGGTADLDKAVATARQTLSVAAGNHPARPVMLANLSVVLQIRFEREGELTDLDEAVDMGRQSVRATPSNDPYLVGRLNALGVALQLKFTHGGDLAVLDEAIDVSQRALAATSDDQPNRSVPLQTLGFALLTRFMHVEDPADLEQGIAANEQAVRVAPPGRPDRAGMFGNLSVALLLWFERGGGPAALDRAVTAARQAVDATSAGHPSLARHLSNLAAVIRVRYEQGGDPADLDEAIRSARRALGAIHDAHPYQATVLGNLSMALRARYKRGGDPADLDKAVDLGRQAVGAGPPDRPDRIGRLIEFGATLQARMERSGMAADEEEALETYAEAAAMTSAAPSLRIDAAWRAARLAAATAPARAADLLDGAVRLLPDVSPRRLRQTHRQNMIGRFAGLAAEAAAAALNDPSGSADERAVRALRLLEAGRAVLLSQTLQTRSDLTTLREQHPQLAERYVQVRDRLDRPAAPAGLTAPELPEGRLEPDAAAAAEPDRHQLAAELADLQARIRDLAGFASFALPPTVEELMDQASEGPVVTFNISPSRCDALLLTKTGVTALELPELTHTALGDQINAFHQALADASDPAVQERLREILAWLWDVAAGPVLHALGHDRPPPSGTDLLRRPRIWWAPGGPMGLLPIHAAGHHQQSDPEQRTVMDRVVSSYIPTIGALRHARRPYAPASPGPVPALVVAMPTTPGLAGGGPLRQVARESGMLRDRLPGCVVLTEPDPPATGRPEAGQVPTTKRNVLDQLSGRAVAHFACHGVSDAADPSLSRLLLHDHAEDPLTVASLAPVILGNARLAYLSACNTALTSVPDLLDEAIHLATAFQLTGFAHVIGTMWEINDRYAVRIADAFYAELTRGETVDAGRSAYALHRAVQRVRERVPLTPSAWASHLHAGA